MKLNSVCKQRSVPRSIPFEFKISNTITRILKTFISQCHFRGHGQFHGLSFSTMPERPSYSNQNLPLLTAQHHTTNTTRHQPTPTQITSPTNCFEPVLASTVCSLPHSNQTTACACLSVYSTSVTRIPRSFKTRQYHVWLFTYF
jgi:hypothetical protein